MEQIIIGMDGSSGAAGALRWALREGDLHGGPVTATLVWDYLNQHHSDGSTTFHPGYDSAAAQEALASFVIGAVGERDANRVGLNLVGSVAARRAVARPGGGRLDQGVGRGPRQRSSGGSGDLRC